MADAPAYGKPAYNAPLGTHVVTFDDDGVVPNSRWPLVVRQGAVTPDADDPAATLEHVFAKNGWTNSWRDGVFASDDFSCVGAYDGGRDYDILRDDPKGIAAARKRIAARRRPGRRRERGPSPSCGKPPADTFVGPSSQRRCLQSLVTRRISAASCGSSASSASRFRATSGRALAGRSPHQERTTSSVTSPV
jgi:hypothetical protein